MFGFFGFIRSLFGGNEPTPAGRLSAAEARTLAERAAAGQPDAGLLKLATLGERDGRQVWFVQTATVGSALEVVIDDLSGRVLHIGRVGVR